MDGHKRRPLHYRKISKDVYKRQGRHKPDLWIVTEDMTSQPNQPWRADRTTPVILITGNPDAVEITQNSGKLTVLSMPLSIVDLRKTVEIYVS